MKKLVYLAALCAAVVSFDSCKSKKVAQTPALAAKEYTEGMCNGNYDAFVEMIVFEEAVAPAKPEVKKAHSTALKTIHKPSVDEKGGVKEVAVVSEKVAPDGKTADVVLTNTYNNGHVETVNYKMVNDAETWKIRVNDNKEVWRAITKDGDHEVIKIRDGKDRDFVKTKEDGEKQFVKEITKRNGQVEVIKTLENGERHREVLKDIEDGNRHIEKIKEDGEKSSPKTSTGRTKKS